MAKEPAACDYLTEGRLCKAIGEQTEGKDVRKRFCTNDPKNYCCYLCSNREACEISCTFLDHASRPLEIDASTYARIEAETKKYQDELARLSVLLADGKIGEKSYLAASNAINNKIDELKKIKENPKTLITSPGASLNIGEFEGLTDENQEKPTSLWYLVPFFFGIIGGIVGYVGTKDEDRDMADGLLIFGIFWTIILGIAYYAILASILSRL